MQKVLNQDEIDAMFRAARRAPSEPQDDPARKIIPWNVRQVGQISRDQLRTISTLHEAFARNLTHSLGAYLRIVFETNLVSVEQLTYREVLARIPDLAYLASFRMDGANATAALYLDLALAFPIIDLLLGGSGSPKTDLREVTEIEDQILAGVVTLICHELQSAWTALGLTFEFDQHQPAAQMQRLMPPNEKTLCLSFEIRMPESQGTLTVAFPAAVSNALLRKMSDEWGAHRSHGESQAEHIKPHLLDSVFEAELSLPAVPITARELMVLRPGSLLRLPRQINVPPVLTIAGTAIFEAYAVRSGVKCAAQLGSPVTPASIDKEIKCQI